MNIHQPQTTAKALDSLPERLHHFGFVVKDQEVNRRFFEDVLGFLVHKLGGHRFYFRILRRLRNRGEISERTLFAFERQL